MSAAQSIQRLGFRRWYERQLIEGHAYLVTSFLSAIVAAACLEMLLEADQGKRMKAGVALAALVLSWCAGRGYLRKLAAAEQWAKHAVCPQCAAYGRFAVLTSGGARSPGAEPDAAWVRVQCKQCQTLWVVGGAVHD